jgi:ABC-2 type transport system ATP-binding protein
VPALRIERVSKRFGTITALDGVSLEIAPGEVRGLIGPNGAGKTTLLRVVLGLVEPDAGSVTVDAQPMAGFVEEPRFYPYLSGRVNLELLAELDRGAGRERVGEVLAQVGLADRASERVAGYSSGMRQRLGIASALLGAPRLLVLDEPTSAVDPGGVEDVLSIIRRLAATGVAALVSSHQLDALDTLCDSYTVLDQGSIVWDGTAARRRAQAPPAAYRLRTSDDRRALVLASDRQVERATDTGHGIEIVATEEQLDDYVVALGSAGIAVRRLQAAGR